MMKTYKALTAREAFDLLNLGVGCERRFPGDEDWGSLSYNYTGRKEWPDFAGCYVTCDAIFRVEVE